MTHRGTLTADVLQVIDGEVEQGVERWLSERPEFVENWHRVIEEAQRSGIQEFSLYSMTCRKLGDLMRLL